MMINNTNGENTQNTYDKIETVLQKSSFQFNNGQETEKKQIIKLRGI